MFHIKALKIYIFIYYVWHTGQCVTYLLYSKSEAKKPHRKLKTPRLYFKYNSDIETILLRLLPPVPY